MRDQFLYFMVVMGLITMGMSFSVNALSNQEVWKIAVTDWPPYVEEDSPNQGVVSQKLKEKLKERGIELVLEFYPWTQAREIAKGKGYVGYFPAWPEGVGEGFVSSGEVASSGLTIAKRKFSYIQFKNVSSLFRDYKVCVVESYHYPASVEALRLEHAVNTIAVENDKALLTGLTAETCDVAITDPLVMRHYMEENGQYDIEFFDYVLLSKPLVIALRNEKDNKRRIDLVHKMLRTMN